MRMRVKQMQNRLVDSIFKRMLDNAVEKLETPEAKLLREIQMERYKKKINN